MNNPIIIVEGRMAYGRKLFYPTCETGKIFLKLTRRETLTEQDMDVISELGFTVAQDISPILRKAKQ